MATDHAQYEGFVNQFFSSLSQNDFEKAQCLFCGNRSMSYPLFQKGTLRVVRCQCGFVYSERQPTQKALELFYEKSEAMSAWSEIKSKSPIEHTRQKDKFSEATQFISRNPEIKSVLDVGCGNGVFLSLLREANPLLDLSGLEINLAGYQFCLKHGLSVYLENLETYFKCNNRSFDCITLWGALEHLKDPRNTLKLIHQHLSPGGWIIICVPNVDSRIIRFARRECFTFCPQHLWYFNWQKLSELLTTHQFKVMDHHWYTIEPEEVPIMKMEFGIGPYEHGPLWGHWENTLKRKKISEEILNNNEGYKIVAFARKPKVEAMAA